MELSLEPESIAGLCGLLEFWSWLPTRSCASAACPSKKTNSKVLEIGLHAWPFRGCAEGRFFVVGFRSLPVPASSTSSSSSSSLRPGLRGTSAPLSSSSSSSLFVFFLLSFALAFPFGFLDTLLGFPFPSFPSSGFVWVGFDSSDEDAEALNLGGRPARQDLVVNC